MKKDNGTSKTAPIRVLVIEDNEDDSALLLRQLKKAEMAEMVHFLCDGTEALDYLEAHHHMLAESLMVIFLDLKLPRVSGLDVLRRLRAKPAFIHTPVIVMTSSNDPKEMEECQRWKIANYVQKPVTFPLFSKAMADVFHLPKGGT